MSQRLLSESPTCDVSEFHGFLDGDALMDARLKPILRTRSVCEHLTASVAAFRCVSLEQPRRSRCSSAIISESNPSRGRREEGTARVSRG